MPSVVEGIGWKAHGDRVAEFPNPKPFFPRIKHSIKLIPLSLRIVLHTFYEWFNGREPFIDIFNVFKHFSYTGVPIGGIGCGSIGTDYRGGFGRFSIIPGIKEQTENIKADQFIVSVHSKSNGSLIYQSLLSCADLPASPLESWKTMEKCDIRYRGLFPCSWTEFRLANTGIIIVQEQLSPVIPNDYKDSSLPVASFKFHVFNNSNEDVDVSIVFTFRNGTGKTKWNCESVCESRNFSTKYLNGRTLSHTVKGMPVTYGIGTKTMENCETFTSVFDPTGNGNSIYSILQQTGELTETEIDISKEKPKELGIAVCSKFPVSKNSTGSTIFALTWYMPEVRFGTQERTYIRRYSRFFNGLNCHKTTQEIIEYSIGKYEEWKAKIENWQNPIINNDMLPEWYRSAIFNELYYIVDGSTIWVEYDKSWKEHENLMSSEAVDHFIEFGRFGYMESWEYLMLNTYDVHFYSSWAILKNWPNLEMSIQLDFADQVNRVDRTVNTSLAEGHRMEIKNSARIPHDMGNPLTDPWIHTNCYILHDTSDWKDLNMKFVINCWRDWKLIASNHKNAGSILKMFSTYCSLIIDRALKEWDSDGDGMIENSGFADQTYDVWTMTGTSSYCGSLWIAALTSYIEILKELKSEQEFIEKYQDLLQKSKKVFVDKLWNGNFFAFDENPVNKDVIMADQLSGIWAVKSINRELDFENEKVISSLSTVYKMNVCGYENGTFGAVNGFLTSGTVDESNIQSEEVWGGITYALSAFMIEMDLIDEGFKTAEGHFNSTWNRFPLQYQTPEAITSKGMYRALGYMRPMSIWAIQHALEGKSQHN